MSTMELNILLVIVFQFSKILQRTGYLELLLLLWVMIVKLLAKMLREFLGLLSEQDLNAFNEEKNTALHWACLNGHIEVIITFPMSGKCNAILKFFDKCLPFQAVKKLILAGANVSVLNRSVVSNLLLKSESLFNMNISSSSLSFLFFSKS
jgi:ankyrin repeat protein